MQTETLFRAARAINVVRNSIHQAVGFDTVQISFHSLSGLFCVILTGQPVGTVEGEPGTLTGTMTKINAYAASLGEDAFALVHTGGGTFMVEAR